MGGCQYIAGEPSRCAKKCGEPTLPDKPWCAAHYEVCVVPVIVSKEERVAYMKERESDNGASGYAQVLSGMWTKRPACGAVR